MHERIYIQNQSDPAITQNRGTSEQVLLAEGLAQILDHDLLLAEQFIHEETARGVAGLDHDDDPFRRVNRPARCAQVLTQAQEWS